MSTPNVSTNHGKTQAREWSLQFLYQCEIEKIFYFSETHLKQFSEDHKIPAGASLATMRIIVQGVQENYDKIDTTIREHSKNWTVERMPVIDRCILRLASFEILHKISPRKVAINEAIELAKKFGSNESANFINAVLDKIHPSENLL